MVAESRQAMIEFWVISDTSASWKRLAAALEGISKCEGPGSEGAGDEGG